MIVTAHSPRASFSIPVNINLQGARRRQTRAALSQSQTQESQRRRSGRDGRCSERVKPQTLLPTVGDGRAILVGFTMMAFSMLMFFVVGITLVKPHLQSDWGKEVNCTVIQVEILDEWSDCRGLTRFPCVQVFVNISSSGTKARLHYDEKSIDLNVECFYTPKCQRNESDLLQEATEIKRFLNEWRGATLLCRFSGERYPEDTILYRKYNRWLTLWYLLWPSLMLGGGMLLIGLVKLNQRLAQLCAELNGQEDLATQTATMNGKLYQLLSWRPRGSGSSTQESTGQALSDPQHKSQSH